MSSKPTIDTWPGTLTPSAWAAWSAPIAMWSVAVTIAVGGSAMPDQVAEGVGTGAGIVEAGVDVFVERRACPVRQAFDEAGPPFADVAVRAAADESEPSMAELGEMVDRGRDTAPVVDVDRSPTPASAVPCHMATTGTWDAARSSRRRG